MALGGVLVGVALGAEELVVLGGEGLVHQRALAHEAVEAVLVPVAVLVGQVLWRAKRDIQRERVTLVFSLFGWSCTEISLLASCITTLSALSA